jgi:hypothetical protein
VTATEGRQAVLMAGVPALTLREIRLSRRDKEDGRHWAGAYCWCNAGHDGREALTLVAPPWDEARDRERVR